MITFNIDWITALQFGLAIVLPLLVGIVTTKVTASNVKAIVLAFLALLSGVGTELLVAATSGEAYDLAAGLFRFVSIFVVSVATHFGVWKAENKNGVSVSSYLQENVGVTAK